MHRIKIAAATGIVAAAVAVGGLVAAPSASAAPMTCAQALALANHYNTLADIALNVFNNPGLANYYVGRARGVMEAGC